jgi:site-specific DNA-adenine methylase
MTTRHALKWPGRKASIIDTLRQHLPAGKRLVESFVGSGAVFLNTDYDSANAACRTLASEIIATMEASTCS